MRMKKKALIFAAVLILLVGVGMIALKIVGTSITSPYPGESPLRLPEGAVVRIDIQSNPQWGDPQFHQTSTNSLAAQQLISIINHGSPHDYHWCSCVGIVKLSYATGQQIKFGYCPGHDPFDYEVVKISESSDGELSHRSYSGVSKADFVAAMHQLGIDDAKLFPPKPH